MVRVIYLLTKIRNAETYLLTHQCVVAGARTTRWTQSVHKFGRRCSWMVPPYINGEEQVRMMTLVCRVGKGAKRRACRLQQWPYRV